MTGACVGTGCSTPLAENEGWGFGGVGGKACPPLPTAVRRMWWVLCVILIHPLQAASFHRHAPHKHRLRAMFVGLFLLVVELKWGASTLSVSAETRERGQVCLRVFKGRSEGRAGVTGRGGGLSSWRLSGGPRDVWSGRSAALAAPPRPPPSRSRTRGRPRWGWTLCPRGARTFHLEEGGEGKKIYIKYS